MAAVTHQLDGLCWHCSDPVAPADAANTCYLLEHRECCAQDRAACDDHPPSPRTEVAHHLLSG